MTRADYITQFELPPGMVLDCACGSGIQLAAYASRLKRPALGIELDYDRAIATCLNLNTIARRFSTFGQGWHRRSIVVAGDGTASEEISSITGFENNSIALLMLDLLDLEIPEHMISTRCNRIFPACLRHGNPTLHRPKKGRA